MKLDVNTIGELEEVLQKMEKIPVSSMPDAVQDRYQYIRELL